MKPGADSTQPERERMPAEIEPREALRLALDTARQELLEAAARIPAEERSTRAVCGVWTTKDLVGHIADWEQFGVEGLRLMAVGQAPAIEQIKDIEAWNQTHARARHDQPWEVVWGDLNRIRHDLLETLARMGSPELQQSFAFPWGEEGTAIEWVSVFVRHDQEHAADLRAAGLSAGWEPEA
jgi:hypothetical protein